MKHLFADELIPFVDTLFRKHFTVQRLPMNDLQNKDISSADVLLTRSVTRLNESLLSGCRVKIVASPTSGIDHMDTDWLTSAGIHYEHAPGCNAIAVAEYVLTCVAWLTTHHFLSDHVRVGIIGCGHVGRTVKRYLSSLASSILEYDPPRAQRDPSFFSTPLEAFSEIDLLCVHPSLTRQGDHPSFHLLNKQTLSFLKRGTVIINASRGEIIESQLIKQYADSYVWCLDVFEREPNVDREVVAACTLATPHIAGYTKESKARGIYQLYQAIMKHYGYPIEVGLSSLLSMVHPSPLKTISTDQERWKEDLLRHFDVHAFSTRFASMLKESQEVARTFYSVRDGFELREERIRSCSLPLLVGQ